MIPVTISGVSATSFGRDSGFSWISIFFSIALVCGGCCCCGCFIVVCFGACGCGLTFSELVFVDGPLLGTVDGGAFGGCIEFALCKDSAGY